MEERTATELVRAPEIFRPSESDPFFQRVQEIHDLIARRAYELFEASGSTHGHALENWLHAQSEILRTIPLEITETETELTVCAEVPGFSEEDLEVRVGPRRLYITGNRANASERKQGKTVYSERQANQIFRAMDLPVEIDPVRAQATLSDGVLEVRLPKAETGKQIPLLAKAASA